METNQPKLLLRFRSLLIIFTGISISLPIAWISLAKIFLLLSGLIYLTNSYFSAKKIFWTADGWTSKVIWTTLAIFSISLAWTDSILSFAFLALVKHAKLLGILLLLALIKTIRDARMGVVALMIGQSFLLLSSWLLAFGVPIPWTLDQTGKYVVFSSYLDQSIMFASMAAVAWHLRNEGLWPKWVSTLFTVAALINVFFLLEGRTGHVVGVVVFSLIVMWSVPKPYRFIAFGITSLLLSLVLYAYSLAFNTRLSGVVTESQQYAQKSDIQTSAGWRLNAWHRSLEAIQEKPFLGHGVGSWALTVKRIEGKKGASVFGEGNSSNPHQEYLLWGVELGIVGLLLFLLLLFSIAKDALQYSTPIQRSIFSVAAVLAVACLFNSVLYDDLIGDYFCITLGLLMAYGIQTRIAETKGLD
ncbi:MAG: O-antigen ligase family protein [Sulfuritalea sp.]|nr:O-antigen ligase family protein [Sulfuritalea sp.]